MMATQDNYEGDACEDLCTCESDCGGGAFMYRDIVVTNKCICRSFTRDLYM